MATTTTRVATSILAIADAPPTHYDAERADLLLQQAWEKGSVVHNLERAVAWATDTFGTPFTFPCDSLTNHAHTLAYFQNSLPALINHQQNILRSRTRLSHESIAATMTIATRAQLTDPLDEERIHNLVDGICIPTSANFIPQHNPEPLRPRYRQAMPAVQKLLYAQVSDGTILVLPTATLLASHHTHPIHYQSLGWTTKSEADCGRVTGDMSFSDWVTTLNGKTADEKADVRQQIVAKWGEISLPTLFDIVDDILFQADTHGWHAISLYKKDVRAAFHRLLFHPDFVGLTAFALDEIYTILHLVGNFGWSGTPFAWDVVGRIMKAAASHRVQGSLRLYVDDFFGACLTAYLHSNNVIVDDVIVTLLGPDALAPHKDMSGRKLVILGWHFDLDARRVSISETNLLKTLFAFMDIGSGSAVTLHQLERAASLATRYSVLCRPMASFTVALYRDIPAFRGNRNTYHHLSNASKVDIALWLAYLTLVGTHPECYGRHLESFRPNAPASVDIGFDGSLGGVGVGLQSTTDATTLAYTGIFPLPCAPTSDSSFQNTFELLSITTGLLLALSIGLRNFSYTARGDSTVTLSWLENDKVATTLGRRAGIAFAIISATVGAHNVGTTFVPGKENSLYDALSRGWTTAGDFIAASQHIHPVPTWLPYICDPSSYGSTIT